MIVVVSLERAEQTLLAGDMPCPRCQGVLRPFGTGRTRTVRGVGADTVTVTPRRARCRDCSATQILLPTELVPRRADSTEAIGAALVARARGAGYRSIAAHFGRPESTVRRWLRAVREPHAQWLYRRGRGPGRDNRPGVAGPPGAAVDDARARVEPARRRSRAVPRMLRPQRPGLVADRILRSRAASGRSAAAAAQLKFGSRRALPRPARPVTMQTKPALRMPDDRHLADQAVTLPKKQRKSICILDEFFVGKISDGQHWGGRQRDHLVNNVVF